MTDEDFDAARANIVVFLVTRETAAGSESITGSLREGSEKRWTAVYRRNGEVYASQPFQSRMRAEVHLEQQRATLEAAGWTPGPPVEPSA